MQLITVSDYLSPEIPDVVFDEKELQKVNTVEELIPYLKFALTYLHSAAEIVKSNSWFWPQKYDQLREALHQAMIRVVTALPLKEDDASLVVPLQLNGFYIQSFSIVDGVPTNHRLISMIDNRTFVIMYFSRPEEQIVKKIKEDIERINPKAAVISTEHLIPLLVLGAEYLERHKEEMEATGTPQDYIDYRFALEVFCTLYLLNPDHSPNEKEMEKVRKKGFSIVREYDQGKSEFRICRDGFCVVIFQGQ